MVYCLQKIESRRIAPKPKILHKDLYIGTMDITHVCNVGKLLTPINLGGRGYIIAGVQLMTFARLASWQQRGDRASQNFDINRNVFIQQSTALFRVV